MVPAIGLCVVLALLLPGINTYSYGGPDGSCVTPYPKHKTDAQQGKAPYTISVDRYDYRPGDILTVTLAAERGVSFRGYMLVASRLRGDTEELVGDFVSVPQESKAMAWYPQKATLSNCVTHSTKSERSNITVEWKAPDWESAGDIVFRASVVKTYEEFWVELKSPTVKALEKPIERTLNHSVSLDFSEMQLAGECGTSKGCMMFPRHCKGLACTHVVTFSAQPEGVMFEARVVSQGYLSVAFSKDKMMGEDESVTCLLKDDFVSVQHGFNPAYYNKRKRAIRLSKIETKRDGDYLYCRWLHPYVNTMSHKDYSTSPPTLNKFSFDLRKPWYLQLAHGRIYPGADVVAYHTELPLVSQSPVSFTENNIIYADGLPLYIKIHALLGTVAWMLLASLSMVVSRYFKNDIFTKKLNGVAAWFHIHRALSFITSILTIAAVVLVFAVLQKFSTRAFVHAVVGLVLVGIMVLQILAGLCRPEPGTKARPVFNWMHRFGGMTMFALASASLLLSTYTTWLNPELSKLLFILFIIWIALQGLWIFILDVLVCCEPKPKGATNGSINNTLPPKESPQRQSATKGFILVMYFISNVTLTAAVNVYVFLY